MLRHYYVANDLPELKTVAGELNQEGFTTPQIHVLSEDDHNVKQLGIPDVESVLRKDVVHSTELGAAIGILLSACTLLLVYIQGWHESAAGWMPFVFLAIVITGFCTWEGGFIGIQTTNVDFKRFKKLLNKGKHILFVDARPEQEIAISKVMKTHPDVTPCGFGEARPNWVIATQDNYQSFMKSMP